MSEPREDRVVKRFDLERLRKQTKLPMITVYKHPKDYPEQYVARVWDANRPTNLIALADTLDELREAIPQGMYNLGRQPQDDPCIVEVWI